MKCRCKYCGATFQPANNDVGTQLCDARACLTCYRNLKQAGIENDRLNNFAAEFMPRGREWVPFIHAKRWPSREEFAAAVSRGEVD